LRFITPDTVAAVKARLCNVSSARAKAELGWKPEFPFRKSLKDTMLAICALRRSEGKRRMVGAGSCTELEVKAEDANVVEIYYAAKLLVMRGDHDPIGEVRDQTPLRPVDVLSVANLEDDHHNPIVEDLVNYAVVPNANPVHIIVALELSGTMGSRLLCELSNRFDHPAPVAFCESSKLLFRGVRELDAIRGHRASDRAGRP
jgi:hypothetical protein